MSEASYLAELKRNLAPLPRTQGNEIYRDVRAHFADAAASGHSFEQAAAMLGTPAQVAAHARGQLAAPSAGERAARVLQLAAVAVSFVAAVFLAFLLPVDPTEQVDQPRTLAEAAGFGVVLVLLVPALIAAAPLVVPVRWRQAAGIASAAALLLVGGVCFFDSGLIVAGLTFGYLPAAWLALAALLVPWALRRGHGRVLRWLGGAIVAVPPVFLLALGIGGSIGLTAEFVVVTVVQLAIAVGMMLRWRPSYVASVLVGVALLVLGILEPGMLLLAIWVEAGLFLTVGLAGWLATGTRRGKPAP